MAYNYYSSGYQEDLGSYYHYDNQSYCDYYDNDNQSYTDYYDNDDPSYTNYYPSYGYETCEPTRYVQDYDTQYHGNAYQLAPSQSIVGYYYHSSYDQHEYPADKDAKYDDLATTGYIVSLSNAEPQNDLDFEEYNPEPFHGGYDMKETYGEPLPPSNDICYPPSKIQQPFAPLKEQTNLSSIPPPYGKEEKLESEAKLKDEIPVGNLVKEEQVPTDFEEDDDGEYDEEEEEEDYNEDEEGEEEVGDIEEPEEEQQQQQGELGIVVYDHKQPSDFEGDDEEDEEEEQGEEEEEESRENFDEKGAEETQIRRQIPPGYGMEAIDLCEGVLGGYFPCLSKRKQVRHDQRCDCKCHQEINYYSYEDCWSKTADYLFGNPNPYGGSMPEKGSYGDPVYSYQRYYPQKPLTQHVDYGGDYELLQSSRYAYGYNQDYYHV